MKILLVSITMGALTEELGICMIASVLKRDFEVDVVSYSINSIDENDYKEMQTFAPDAIGINIYEATRKKVYEICRILKEILPAVMIFVGGTEAFCNPERILNEEDSVDFVVSGEGEITTAELIQAWQKNGDYYAIDGLSFRDGKNIIINKPRKLMDDITHLPPPDRSILVKNKIKIASISTSRGCSGNCSFCITPIMWTNKKMRWRGLDDEQVLDEIQRLSEQGVLHLFINDCSYEDPKTDRMLTIAKGLIERNIKIYYSVDFKPNVHKRLNEQDISLLKQSGLINVFIGIEAGNTSDLKLYNKGTTVEDSENVMKFFNQHNINQHFGFINFNPYSTFDTLRENAQFLTENQHLSFGNVFNYATALMLFETTALYEKVRRDKLLLDDYSGLFKYKFCDPKIQVLAEFMVLTFSDIQRSFGNIVMHDLADKYIDVLSILQKELSASDHYKDLLDLIAETKEKAKSDIIKHFHFHEFFNELIALSENSWNADKALKIVNSAYDKKTWMRAIEKIKKDRMLLYKQILMTDSFSRKLLSSLT